ncbi:hypothetical protein ACWEOG_19985 [Amycolatopsis japonica]
MLAKPLLFLSSFSPLFTLLAFRFDRAWLVISCAALALMGGLAAYLILHIDSRSTPGVHKIVSVRDAGSEAAAYLGAYLLPFVTVSTPTVRDALAYLGFMLVAASVYIRSSVVQINPLLYILGYRVLAVEDSNAMQAYLIIRRRITPGDTVWATRLGVDVIVDRTPKKAIEQ